MQSHFVQTAGIRMHYVQQGTGEPVVFIHGFPETSYEWRHQFAALSDSYACFAPDTRGFGRTEKPGARASRHLLARDIIEFMDALGIERAAVVGHDWGGIIAFKVAIDWPERVTRLALLDTLCTVWAPGAVHGYWFKANALPEQFFARYHREFIETVFGANPERQLPDRPASPWQSSAQSASERWATGDDIAHYANAFADPASQASAISYYRYALPFHVVTPDASASHGEHFRSLTEVEVGGMWGHPDGLEQHPLYPNFMDFGPGDRHKRFPNPALWMYGTYLARSRATAATSRPVDMIPRGNPFIDQFSRYFPDLRARRVDAGHFFPEEAPEVTNEVLRAFLSGAI